MTEDEKTWMRANRYTKMEWTEDNVIAELYKEDLSCMDTMNWCKIMLAGILGSEEAAMKKYPELWI